MNVANSSQSCITRSRSTKASPFFSVLACKRVPHHHKVNNEDRRRKSGNCTRSILHDSQDLTLLSFFQFDARTDRTKLKQEVLETPFPSVRHLLASLTGRRYCVKSAH